MKRFVVIFLMVSLLGVLLRPSALFEKMALFNNEEYFLDSAHHPLEEDDTGS